MTWHHCILYQESLATKSLDMFNVTRVVISTVNWIRANALNHHKFKKFFADADDDYGDLAMFDAVRSLSRATCLKRFYDLVPEIKTFFEERRTFLSLASKNGLLIKRLWSISPHILSLNRTLQGNNKFYHDWSSTASAFIKKLCRWKTQLANGATTHFPTLSNHKTNRFFDANYRLISNLIDEFERRIGEMNSFLSLMKMFANPMSIDAMTAPDDFQLELLDMQSDVELRQPF